MKTVINIFVAIAVSMVAGILPVCALTVESRAGHLHEAVGDEAGTAVALTVIGTMDVRDFEFVSAEMPALAALDLSGTRIVEYNGEATALGRTSAPADVLPECALMCMNLKHVALPVTLAAIADGALGASGIEAIDIPAGVKSLGTAAFGNCRSLKSIVVPAAVENMGINVFKGCTALETATVAASVDELPECTFMGCTALKKVTLPVSLISIGGSAFAGCSALVDCAFPASLTNIGNKAFAGTALAAVDLGNTAMKSIGDWAFADCANLGVVEFGNELQTMGKGAFYNDATLRLAALPKGLTEVDDFSLRGIGNVGETALADTKVGRIGDFALANWKCVQAFTLPASLRSIGNGAMANWSDVKAIYGTTLLAVPVLGADVWRGVAQNEIDLFVPDNLESQFKATDQWKEFNVKAKNSTTDEMMIQPGREDGVMVHFEGMSLVVEADDEIAGVQLFDVQGRSFILPAYAESRRVVVDTSAWGGAVLIVRVALADGSSAALKLMR